MSPKSTFALRALGAVTLPGALLAVVAPTASALEVSPDQVVSTSSITNGIDDSVPSAPDTNAIGSASHIDL